MNVRKLDAVRMALAEDVGLGDVTTQATVAPDRVGTGRLWVKERGVLAGLDAAILVFKRWIQTWFSRRVQPMASHSRLEQRLPVFVGDWGLF